MGRVTTLRSEERGFSGIMGFIAPHPLSIKSSFLSAKILVMKDIFYYIQIFIKYWPLVNKVVQLVEKLKSDAPSEEKKAYALQMITNALNLVELPEDKKQKITAVLSAFIDLVVAVNNLFGLWK